MDMRGAETGAAERRLSVAAWLPPASAPTANRACPADNLTRRRNVAILHASGALALPRSRSAAGRVTGVVASRPVVHGAPRTTYVERAVDQARRRPGPPPTRPAADQARRRPGPPPTRPAADQARRRPGPPPTSSPPRRPRGCRAPCHAACHPARFRQGKRADHEEHGDVTPTGEVVGLTRVSTVNLARATRHTGRAPVGQLDAGDRRAGDVHRALERASTPRLAAVRPNADRPGQHEGHHHRPRTREGAPGRCA